MAAQIHFSDVELPKASIQRIIKDASEGKFVQKDAKLAFSKAATVFVSFLSAVSAEECRQVNGKTLSAAHIEAGLEAIGFGEWREEVKRRVAARTAGSVAHSSSNAHEENDKEEQEDVIMEDSLEDTQLPLDMQ